MADRTSLTTDAAGRRVMAKSAADAEEADRLEREAASLEAGRHPGVVELVGVDGHGVGAVLLTAHVDGPTLAQMGLLPLEEGAGLLAALATTLADLHDLGLVHGAVAPEHVIVGPGGRPVLCSLGYGGEVGSAAAPAPGLGRDFTDPCRADGNHLSPTVDVFGLGALARFLAPHPPEGHVMARVGAEATAAEPADRPSARAVAKMVQHHVPAARLPRALAPQPPGPVARPGPRPADPLDAWRRGRGGLAPPRGVGVPRRAALATALVLAGLGAATLLVGTHGSSRPGLASEADGPAVAGAPTAPDEVVPGPTTTRAGPIPSTAATTPPAPGRTDCPPATGLLQADVDGDGCADTLRYADGVLVAGSTRWLLGQPGDQVATGDWACQGRRTLALFRPATGQIFRFDGWAAPDHDLQATVVGVVAGGQALRAADVDRDGCHEIVVERATGPAEIIRLPRVRP